MKVSDVFDHHHAVAEWGRRGSQEWLEDVFEAPGIHVTANCTADVREHVRKQFEQEGWALDVKVDSSLGLSVFAVRDDLAFQLQTGNISRAAYDLLKLQFLFASGRIEAAALAVPSKDAAAGMGSNIAYYERIANELKLFDRVITVPIVLVAFK